MNLAFFRPILWGRGGGGGPISGLRWIFGQNIGGSFLEVSIKLGWEISHFPGIFF